MISILVPVYRESKYLGTLLDQLTSDAYDDKEIIAVVDEPTSATMRTVNYFDGKVRFIINKSRKGKSNALNGAASLARGDILLFLDSDVILSKSDGFIGKVAEKMEGIDLLDIKKNVLENNWMLSRLFSYESLSTAISSWIFGKTDFCIGISGQAFAIKTSMFREIGGLKSVIAEDAEVGIQTYLKKGKFAYTDDIEIFSRTPSSWRELFTQRRRWGLGSGYHLRKYWKCYALNLAKHPKQAMMAIYYLVPSIVSMLSLFFIDSLLGKVLMLSLVSMSLRFEFLVPFVFSISSAIILWKNLVIFLAVYASSFLSFFIASRRFSYRFSSLEFTFYYLFFSPVILIVYGFYFLKAVVSLKLIMPDDWKV